jgi:hypothetical protein
VGLVGQDKEVEKRGDEDEMMEAARGGAMGGR